MGRSKPWIQVSTRCWFEPPRTLSAHRFVGRFAEKSCSLTTENRDFAHGEAKYDIILTVLGWCCHIGMAIIAQIIAVARRTTGVN